MQATRWPWPNVRAACIFCSPLMMIPWWSESFKYFTVSYIGTAWTQKKVDRIHKSDADCIQTCRVLVTSIKYQWASVDPALWSLSLVLPWLNRCIKIRALVCNLSVCILYLVAMGTLSEVMRLVNCTIKRKFWWQDNFAANEDWKMNVLYYKKKADCSFAVFHWHVFIEV